MCSLRSSFVVAVLLAAIGGSVAIAQTPLGTSFTYQGQLRSGGIPANGLHDFEFRLFDAATLGNQVGPTLCLDEVDVMDGLFTVPLDFGGEFMTDGRWLEIAVRADAVPGNCGSGQFTTLIPRQALTAAPFALALPGFWTENNSTSPNIIGGFRANALVPGVVGAVITGGGSAVGGQHAVADNYGFIGGGVQNYAGNTDGVVDNAQYATVSGGNSNWAGGEGASVGGGLVNWAMGDQSTIAGGGDNRAYVQGSTVGGGTQNEASDDYATVAGGQNNTATGEFSTIAGGVNNTCSGQVATIAGGEQNIAAQPGATIAGGADNRVSGNAFGSTIGGGVTNEIDCPGGFCDAAVISGGSNNIIRASVGAIPGGELNIIGLNAHASFAAGSYAQVGDGHYGTFVWSDGTGANHFTSTGPRQFLVRASGGLAINVNDPLGFTLAVNGEAAKPGGGSWAAYSDARLKTDVRPIAGALDQVLGLRGVEFEYSAEAIESGRGRPGTQVGFLAQEVEQVLPDWVGEDAAGFKHLTERGATALLVEALRELRAEKDREISDLTTRLAQRETDIDELRSRLERLERLVKGGR